MFNFETKEIDFLAIGDTTVDEFIRIKDASVHCNINNADCELCVKFGDKIPYEFAKTIFGVGNSANASVSAARLGLNSALLTTIGNDENGRDSMFSLSKNKVITDFINIDNHKKTNYHFVLWYEAERTILVKHEDYTYKIPSNLPKVKWIYLSSLGKSGESFHDDIVEYLNKNPETKLAFQPGTFQINLGIERLKEIYQKSEVFVCNKEESQKILNDFESEINILLEKMHNLGPKIVVITDGPKGAYASDGNNKYFIPIYPDPKPPLERTGCGDAFASTFIAMLIKGKTFQEALLYAPINPMSVVQDIGGQEGLLFSDKMEEFLSNAKEDYKLVNI